MVVGGLNTEIDVHFLRVPLGYVSECQGSVCLHVPFCIVAAADHGIFACLADLYVHCESLLRLAVDFIIDFNQVLGLEASLTIIQRTVKERIFEGLYIIGKLGGYRKDSVGAHCALGQCYCIFGSLVARESDTGGPVEVAVVPATIKA